MNEVATRLDEMTWFFSLGFVLTRMTPCKLVGSKRKGIGVSLESFLALHIACLFFSERVRSRPCGSNGVPVRLLLVLWSISQTEVQS